MPTAVDICNLALASLGDSGEVLSIDPPDGSPQAGLCARWYPFAVRKMLEDFNWSFAKRREKPAPLANVDPLRMGWAYAYEVPSDCVRITSLEIPDGYLSGKVNPPEPNTFTPPPTRQRPVPMIRTSYERQGHRVLTNARDPVLEYITSQVPAQTFPGYFVQALATLLSSYLAGPLLRSEGTGKTMQVLYQSYQAMLAEAITMDAQANKKVHEYQQRIPSSIASRFV